MPLGDCENAFLDAARQEGIELVRYRKPWLNQKGHLGLPDNATSVQGILHGIFLALGGIVAEQESKRTTPLPGDFIHMGSGMIVEVDEIQHFTSFRLKSFTYYPAGFPVGFDVSQYRELCRRLAPMADKYRQSKAAVGFGTGGRQRQRAYYDALRDLATPAMGHPPLIRIPAPDGDGKAAFARNRERLMRAINGVPVRTAWNDPAPSHPIY